MNPPRRNAALIAALSVASFALAQIPPRNAGPPPNAWLTTPTRKSDVDSVSPSVRLLRDRYFDGIIGQREVLTPENAKRRFISEGSFLGEPAEILEFPNRSVLIGIFKSFRSVLSASGRSIYTEVIIRVAEKFEDASGSLRQGADISVALPAGTVTTEAGTISLYNQPRSFFIQPGRTYLFVLEHIAIGDFYMIGKEWDLSDGTVQANSAGDLRRQREGKSTLIGLTRADLVQTLNNRFAVNQ